MEFKYALKGVDGNEEFVDGICLARQFVGRGKWFVWDMRPEKSAKSCQACSSDAERIIIHDRGDRCPKNAAKAARARLAVRAEGERQRDERRRKRMRQRRRSSLW